MTTYYMTSRRSSEIGYWTKCKAITLTGAKREAAARYKGGYRDEVLIIAEGDNLTEPRRERASKKNILGAKWRNYD
jgi:hypothetical protein